MTGGLLEAIAVIKGIKDTITLARNAKKYSGKAKKKMESFLNFFSDEHEKEIYRQKCEFETQEIQIYDSMEKLLENLVRELESNADAGMEDAQLGRLVKISRKTTTLVQSFKNDMDRLTNLKKHKFRLHKKIYKKSKKTDKVNHKVPVNTNKKLSLLKQLGSLERQLIKEEEKEVEVEKCIELIIVHLNSISSRGSTKLSVLLQDFKTLGKLSEAERYLDEALHQEILEDLDKNEQDKKARAA